MSLEETGFLDRNIDRINKLQSKLKPFSHVIRAIQVQSPANLLAEQLRHIEMLERAAFGPLGEIRSLTSHFHEENLWMREIEKRFYLPEINEATNLLHKIEGVGTASIYLDNAIKAMTTPWLDKENKMRSIRGFANLYDIGHAIRTKSAFDPRLTTELRAKLGDWREKISWPPEIFVDPLERSIFYEERGLDPTLTAFPTDTFQQILNIAGLKEESVPSTDEENEEIGFERNNNAHDELQRFEADLRKFIDNKMREAFGENWIKNQVPGDIRKKWKENKETAETNDPAKRALIDYADFPNYEQIIVRNDNWEKVFEPIFCRKNSLQESFRRLYPIRNCVMHARPLIQDDELYLQVEIMRIQRAMDDAI